MINKLNLAIFLVACVFGVWVIYSALNFVDHMAIPNYMVNIALDSINQTCGDNITCYDKEVLKLFQLNYSIDYTTSIYKINGCYMNNEGVNIVTGDIADKRVYGYFQACALTNCNTPVIVLRDIETPSAYYHELCHYNQHIEGRPPSEGECYANEYKNDEDTMPELIEYTGEECDKYNYLVKS